MIPGSFDYHCPTTVDEAVALLGEYGEEARAIAGGHSLIPMMKLRLAAPEHLIDLRRIDSMRGISRDAGSIVIGATTTQAEIIVSPVIAADLPILSETATLIADPQVRAVGTIGGNVANGDPGNDMPALMQCLGADYVLKGPGGERTVAARDFYEGTYFTALEEGELLTAIRIPQPPAGIGWAYEKLKRKVGDYATAAAAVLLKMDGDTCSFASVALTNVGDTPLFAAEAAEALVGSKLDAAAINAAVAAAEAITNPASDGRGPAEYRTKMAGVMVRRAIARARNRAA
ncbi:xanthine dehydrogenase family protein subunit M [Breoghania sp. JC706]|uniref:FAD binding domain-containing protein n=1 Tax=Breoghania sp. JC706 TaxID=3117732 RepID=UPI003009961B